MSKPPHKDPYEDVKLSWVNLVCGVILVWLNLERIITHRPGWFHWVGLPVGVFLLGGELYKFVLRKRLAKAEADEKGDDDDNGPLRSLVFLLQEPRLIEGVAWISHLGTALGVKLNEGGDKAEHFILPTPHPMIGEEAGECFMLKIPEGVFWIFNLRKPYMENHEEFAEQIEDRRLRDAVAAHQAWISVDLLHWNGPDSRDATYAAIGRILSALAGPDVLAIYSPELNRCNEFAPSLMAQLAGGKPLSIFEDSTYAPIVSVEKDDAEMQAAVAEAKRRWPEFAAHFARRDSKKDQPFIVKAPFGKEDDQEFMWVVVDAVDGDLVRGKLANQPHRIPDMHEGQEVTVPAAAIMDWMCVDEREQPVGGWTQRLLAARARHE